MNEKLIASAASAAICSSKSNTSSVLPSIVNSQDLIKAAQKVAESSVLNEQIDARAGKYRMKGSVRATLLVAGAVSAGGLFYFIFRNRTQTDNKIREDNAKADNKIKVNHQSSLDRMNERDNKADNDCRLIRQRAATELEVYAGKKDIDLEYKIKQREAGFLRQGTMMGNSFPGGGRIQPPFEESYRNGHTFPEVPDILKPVFAGIPAGYENGMLLHLLSMFGSLCFSRVRAEYLDGTLVGPNLHVMVSGEAGSGKAKFNTIFNTLFEDVISGERSEYLSQGEKKISQIIGYDITESKLVELLANNGGVHLYLLATEISDMRNKLRKQGGLSYTDIRKSLGGEMVSHMTREKGSSQGLYPIFLNSTLTGTPEEVKKFFKDEIETGTAQRFCFTSIPASGEKLVRLILPGKEEMARIRQQIADWRSKYCYSVDACSGDDTVCEVTTLDLRYISDALEKWLEAQWRLAEKDSDDYLKGLRLDIRARRACIAFHCGIVLHMLWDQPVDEVTRKKVVDACLYIADYITDSYMYNISTMERGCYRRETATQCNQGRREWPGEVVAEMVALHNQVDEHGQSLYGWDTLASMYNSSPNTVKRKVRKYEEEHGYDNNG